MDYGQLFSRAWELCWNNKYLFVLGFLAALGTGAGSSRFNPQFSPEELPPGIGQNLERVLQNMGALLLGAGCLLFILALALWLLRLTAQAGLISAADRLDAGETVSLGAAFTAGTYYLPQMFGLNVLIYLPIWLLFFLSLGSFVAAFSTAIAAGILGAEAANTDLLGGTAGLVGLCAFLLCCLLIPLSIIVSLIYPFAQRKIVLQDFGVIDSIRQSWRFVQEHTSDVVLLLVILLVLGAIFGLVTTLVLFPLSFLAAGPALLRLLSGQTLEVTDILFVVAGGLVLGFISGVVNALYVTYRSVSVTLFFQRLEEGKKAPAG